jgi:hypothetical protein
MTGNCTPSEQQIVCDEGQWFVAGVVLLDNRQTQRQIKWVDGSVTQRIDFKASSRRMAQRSVWPARPGGTINGTGAVLGYLGMIARLRSATTRTLVNVPTVFGRIFSLKWAIALGTEPIVMVWEEALLRFSLLEEGIETARRETNPSIDYAASFLAGVLSLPAA